jgi:CRP/FNR family transcriptional regulator, nitrogen fixation regulation protein
LAADELRNAQEHMLLLGRKNARERVVEFLLDMDRRLPAAGVMALPMCRRDIGDYLGLTLETVSRSLSVLAATGALSFLGSRNIVLHNRERLRAMTG